LVAKTGMVYLWDAKMAKVRRQILREDNGSSVDSNEDDYDPLDAFIDENEGHCVNDEESGHGGHDVTIGQKGKHSSTSKEYYQASNR
jgi:hypothetical protein